MRIRQVLHRLFHRLWLVDLLLDVLHTLLELRNLDLEPDHFTLALSHFVSHKTHLFAQGIADSREPLVLVLDSASHFHHSTDLLAKTIQFAPQLLKGRKCRIGRGGASSSNRNT